MKYSLIGIFGALPVDPDKFETLDPKLKWLGEATEGNKFCTMCGTLSPQTPRKHHPECCDFMDSDTFPEPDSNPLGKCPTCDSEWLGVTSSRELSCSQINCSDCGYLFSKEVPEEKLVEEFLALDSPSTPCAN